MLIALSRAIIYLPNILIRIKLLLLHVKKNQKEVYVSIFRLSDVGFFCEGILAFYENLFKI